MSGNFGAIFTVDLKLNLSNNIGFTQANQIKLLPFKRVYTKHALDNDKQLISTIRFLCKIFPIFLFSENLRKTKPIIQKSEC